MNKNEIHIDNQIISYNNTEEIRNKIYDMLLEYFVDNKLTNEESIWQRDIEESDMREILANINELYKFHVKESE